MITTRFKCPCCGHNLHWSQEESSVVAWCNHGPCESKAAYAGVMGTTLIQAALELVEKVKDEGMDRNEHICYAE